MNGSDRFEEASAGELLSAFFEAVPDAMLLIDDQGAIVQINGQAEIMFRWRRAELTGKPVSALVGTAAQSGDEARRRVYQATPRTGPMGTLFDLTARRKDGSIFACDVSLGALRWRGHPYVLVSVRDISERKRAEEERERLLQELQANIAEVKRLSGLLPICAWCKNIRDDQGYWHDLETYISEHSEAQFTHGVCASCAAKLVGRASPDK